jgi:hypothetical protein
MLERPDEHGTIVISQPAHAWVSRQLAQAWGNEQVGEFAPWAEVVEAAGQHDLAWISWEAMPKLDPRTGRPYTFRSMPTMMHLGVWREAGKLALAYGRYTALLVSKHGSGLYDRYHDFEADSPGEAAAARAYVDAARKFEAELLANLRSDPHYAAYASDGNVERNRRLVAIWDGMSLAICGGFTGQRRIDGVPATSEEMELTLVQADADGTLIHVDPWPFRTKQVGIVCEGRRLVGTFADEEALRAALRGAEWVPLRMTLRPAA